MLQNINKLNRGLEGIIAVHRTFACRNGQPLTVAKGRQRVQPGRRSMVTVRERHGKGAGEGSGEGCERGSRGRRRTMTRPRMVANNWLLPTMPHDTTSYPGSLQHTRRRGLYLNALQSNFQLPEHLPSSSAVISTISLRQTSPTAAHTTQLPPAISLPSSHNKRACK